MHIGCIQHREHNMALKQTDIDEAVLIGKSAAYHLAYELALEVKYGGKMGCCICNLKLLWIWTRHLSCITIGEDGEAIGCLTNKQVDDLIDKIKGLCKFATTSKH